MMLLMYILTAMIFSVMLMGVLLIPLLRAAEAYDDPKEAADRREHKYALLFDVDEQCSSRASCRERSKH